VKETTPLGPENHQCLSCGVSLTPTPTGRGRRRKYCSSVCSKRETAAQAKAKYQASVRCSPVYFLPCSTCGIAFVARAKHQVYCGKPCRKKMEKNLVRGVLLPRTCAECDNTFKPKSKSRTKYCSVVCKKRALHRIHRHKRRALMAGTSYEAVNATKVFVRDGWRCQLCGCKTPQQLRGKHKPNSPELDHILPVSKGGAHNYANTQCACRQCNQEKSDTPKGQLPLVL
jgi:hypothetical protein